MIILKLREVIEELQARAVLAETACEMAGTRAGIAESECDLSTEIWDLCEERKEEVENEGFKMVFELSKEIDALKENLQENNHEIINYKVHSRSLKFR